MLTKVSFIPVVVHISSMWAYRELVIAEPCLVLLPRLLAVNRGAGVVDKVEALRI